jgi:UDP-N-acetylmuramate dehydrogenase
MTKTSAWIQRDYDLGGGNTLGVPCVAGWYATPTNLAELSDSLALAQAQSMPVTILGAGSNVVLPSRLPGMVLRPMMMGIRMLKRQDDYVIVEIGAGENWAEWVRHSLRRRWYGLENLANIPGSVGAAPVQNIGAYGVELSSYLYELTVMDKQTGNAETLSAAQCEFSYRNSIFRGKWRDRKIITAVRMRLCTRAQPHTGYARLQQHLADRSASKISACRVYRAVVTLRRLLPDVLREPNVGSFFVNPELDQPAYQRLLSACPDIKAWPRSAERMRISAGSLLEHCGWKGKTYEKVRVHDRHALVIINDRHCPGETVMRCAEAMRQSVARQFDIHLAVEPRVLL